MTIIIGLLSLVQDLLINKSLSNNNLKTSYLRMFISFYLNRLNEDDEKQTIKITDLPEIFRKIGHDERRILSFLNDLNEDISEHGRLTILIKEAFYELRSKRGDLFKILETVFDSSNRESLGYKLLGQDKDTLDLINQIIEILKNNLGNLLELLNNVQGFVRININENNNEQSIQEKNEYHINEVARYPIIVKGNICTRKDVRKNLPVRDEQLKELVNKTKEVKDSLCGLLQLLKDRFDDLKGMLGQLLQMILA